MMGVGKMNKDNGGPAFPSENPAEFVSGMSLRDYMAIHATDDDVSVALTRHYDAWIAQYGHEPAYVWPTRQEARYIHADTMLAERAK